MIVVVTCGDGARARWGPRTGGASALSGHPAAAEIDAVLATVAHAGRLVVAGDDAAFAAVLTRLLRTERLDVSLGLLPLPGSVAASVWGLPTQPAAARELAHDGKARRSPLVRDERGGVVVGHHRVGPFTGEVYVDEHRLVRGDATALEVRPDPAGHGTTARTTGPRRALGLRPGLATARSGRAVQIGCRPVPVERDGVPDERPVTRRSWYPDTSDWWLARPCD